MQVKKEKDVFKIDLTDDDYSYVHYISKHIQDVYAMYENRSVSVDQYKEYVRRIIADAKDTPKKRMFLLTLAKQRTKLDILSYVNNSMMNGSGFGVI